MSGYHVANLEVHQWSHALAMGVFLASSLSLSGILYGSNAWAHDTVNTVNNGQIIRGGTYFNTPDNKTTFIDYIREGLWVQNGTRVRGVEVDNAGNPTNNGGTLHFYAPGSVVRIDGTVDVSALRNGGGAYLGNGGRVFIDSAYLFQNGNIFANGQNGGLVQMNVARLTMGPTGRTEARGFGGEGGIIEVNSSGVVDLQSGSVLDSSGRAAGAFDTNVINIEGGLINVEGSIRANGIDSRGGTVRLVATGQTDPEDVSTAIYEATLSRESPMFSNEGANQLRFRGSRLSEKKFDGDVRLASSAVITANGSRGSAASGNDPTTGAYARAGDGGTIQVSAAEDVVNWGTIHADGGIGSHTATPGAGGHGGTVVMTAQGQITDPDGLGQVINTGIVTANGGRGGANTGNAPGGQAGNGGLIAFNYDTSMINQGQIEANAATGGAGAPGGHGGNGGLAVFSGLNNPTGGGTILANGGAGGSNAVALTNGGQAGTIVTPDPASANTGQRAVQRGYLNGQVIYKPLTEQTQTNELLTHAENLVLLTRNGGGGTAPVNLFDRMLASRIRSVQDPTGSLGLAREEVISKNTFADFNENPVFRNLIVGNTRDNLDLDMTHPFINVGVIVPELVLPSPLSRGVALRDLNTLTVSNDGSVTSDRTPSNTFQPYTRFWGVDQNISALIKGNFNNENAISAGSINIAASGDITNQGVMGGNTLVIKAGQDFVNHNRRNLGEIYGSVQRYQTGRDFYNLGGGHERNRLIWANDSLQGGIITVDAGRHLRNGVMQPDPDSGPDFSSYGLIRANGTSPTGRGGYIQLVADKNHIRGGTLENYGLIEAIGRIAPGIIKLNEP